MLLVGMIDVAGRRSAEKRRSGAEFGDWKKATVIIFSMTTFIELHHNWQQI